MDSVLLLVCAAILWFHLRQRFVAAVAAGLIGLAACLRITSVFGLRRDAGGHTVSPACWPHVLRFRCLHQ
ncbi:MAG: hypothetical protein IPG06_23860 [Haliea sp.]|nr:hypothetical protein [Haliea sp.]